MEAKISLKDSRIRILKPGIYLFFFTLGLGSTTFITGANILVLMDFLLFSVLIFNFCYLQFLKRGSITIEFPRFLLDSQPCRPQIKLDKPLSPFAGVLCLFWQRFEDSLEMRSSIIHFSNQTESLPIEFPIRGLYRLETMSLNIEFPFPIFCLDLKANPSVEIVVAPNPAKEKGSIDNGKSFHRNVDGEFSKIAPYVAGDPLRRISWKHSAKFNELMVKQYDKKNLGEIGYVIHFEKETEKEIFAQVVSKLTEKMNAWEPFLLFGQGMRFQFDGYHQDFMGLLLFLGKYHSPERLPAESSILGIDS